MHFQIIIFYLKIATPISFLLSGKNFTPIHAKHRFRNLLHEAVCRCFTYQLSVQHFAINSTPHIFSNSINIFYILLNKQNCYILKNNFLIRCSLDLQNFVLLEEANLLFDMAKPGKAMYCKAIWQGHWALDSEPGDAIDFACFGSFT